MASSSSSKVSPRDVAIGAALSLAGGTGVKFAAAKSGVTIPKFVEEWVGPLSTALAATALYFAQRGSNRERAKAHLVGGLTAAGLPVLWHLLSEYGPKITLADGTQVPMFGDLPLGLLTADAGQVSDYVQSAYGLLTEDASPSFGEFDAEQMAP